MGVAILRRLVFDPEAYDTDVMIEESSKEV
jgi:hypothetical protein